MSYSGLHSILEDLCLSDRAFVLMYHRILPSAVNQPVYVQPGMFVKPETFERHMAYIKNNFEVLFLDDLVAKAMAGETIGRHCALTFDDGWRDNYTAAIPILKKYQLPVTIFLSTGYIGATKTFWPEELCQYLEQIDLDLLKDDAAPDSWRYFTSLITSYKSLGRECFFDQSIATLKRFTASEREDVLNYLRNMLNVRPLPRQMLNWDEARNMCQSGLVRFGAHTVNHELLDQVSLPRAGTEIIDSRDEIERQLGSKVKIFAYPNGNHNPEIRQILAQNGFNAAVTTRKGLIDHKLPLLEIPRIALHEDISATIPMFRSEIIRYAL